MVCICQKAYHQKGPQKSADELPTCLHFTSTTMEVIKLQFLPSFLLWIILKAMCIVSILCSMYLIKSSRITLLFLRPFIKLCPNSNILNFLEQKSNLHSSNFCDKVQKDFTKLPGVLWVLKFAIKSIFVEEYHCPWANSQFWYLLLVCPGPKGYRWYPKWCKHEPELIELFEI